MSNSKYLELITSEYKGKPNFTAFLTAFLDKAEDVYSCGKNITSAFDIDTAVGVQLDTLGKILGVDRKLSFEPTNGESTMNDDYYRMCLKAAIAKNTWKGTRTSLEEMLEWAFPDSVFIVNDNQDMSMDVVYVTGSTDQYLLELLQNGYIIPKPEGVNINYSTTSSEVFGWNLDNDAIKGWDEGTWI